MSNDYDETRTTMPRVADAEQTLEAVWRNLESLCRMLAYCTTDEFMQQNPYAALATAWATVGAGLSKTTGDKLPFDAVCMRLCEITRHLDPTPSPSADNQVRQ